MWWKQIEGIMEHSCFPNLADLLEYELTNDIKWQDMTEKKEAPTVHHFTAAMNACAATSMFYVKANFEMSAL